MGSLSSCMSGARYRINKKRSNKIGSASFVYSNEKIKYFFFSIISKIFVKIKLY